jgi:RimJ/RimL family protein N-acetyltransferase
MSLAQAEVWTSFEGERWQQEKGGSWAITRDGSLCGRVGIGGLDLAEGQAGVTYWVLPSVRGQGIAPLALGVVSDWAFDCVGFHRLRLDHSTLNEASCRVASKAGFAAEGVKRADALHLDGWHDMHAHALLADDPRPGRRCS